VNKEVKDQWVAALRSGEYEQGRSYLRSKDPNGGNDKFCCLGVLCDLAVKAGVTEAKDNGYGNVVYGSEDDPNTAYPPHEVVEWADLPSVNPHVPFQHKAWSENEKRAPLTALNDNTELGLGFAGIADLIEEHL
jgi:hypothetical protein